MAKHQVLDYHFDTVDNPPAFEFLVLIADEKLTSLPGGGNGTSVPSWLSAVLVLEKNLEVCNSRCDEDRCQYGCLPLASAVQAVYEALVRRDAANDTVAHDELNVLKEQVTEVADPEGGDDPHYPIIWRMMDIVLAGRQ